MSAFWFVLPLVALWVIPIIVFVVLVPASHAVESTALSAKVPETTVIGSRLDAARQAVDVKVTESSAAEVKAARSGVVTAVSVKAGAKLTNGTPLASVDGTPVLAYIEPFPLYRALSAGAQGPDVQELAQYLSSLGLLPAQSVSMRYGAAIAAATSAFERKVSLTADGTFRPELVAWVPPTAVTVETVQVQVGDSVAPGAVLVDGSQTPDTVQISLTGAGGQAPAVPAGARLRLTSGSAHFDFDSLHLTDAEKAAIDSFLTTAAATGAVSAQQTDSSTSFSGAILTLAAPRKVGVVTSSAVYSTLSGRTCIFLSSKTAVHAVPLATTDLVIGELGSVAVPSKLAGSRAIRDPRNLSAKALRTCR